MSHLNGQRPEDEDLVAIKYHQCPFDQQQAILLVDPDRDVPDTDAKGHKQYYCLSCLSTFSVDDSGQVAHAR